MARQLYLDFGQGSAIPVPPPTMADLWWERGLSEKEMNMDLLDALPLGEWCGLFDVVHLIGERAFLVTYERLGKLERAGFLDHELTPEGNRWRKRIEGGQGAETLRKKEGEGAEERWTQ